MPRHIVHMSSHLPSPLAHEATRLLRRWQASPTHFRTPRGSAWQAPVILIDGRSGSGKTTLMSALSDTLATAGLRHYQVGSLDSWFPGWEGLRAGSHTIARLLTGRPALAAHPTDHPHRAPLRVGALHWDWERDRWGSYQHLNPRLPIVIEGAGSLTPATAAVASLRIWVQAPGDADLRRSRAITRDGDMYAPYWDMWAAQEDQHLADHHPQRLADYIVITGTPHSGT